MQQRPRPPYPYWGWAVLSSGLGATIMMNADSTRAFAVGWAGLVAGLVYLVAANRSLGRQVIALRHVQTVSPAEETLGGTASWPAPRWRSRFKPRPDTDIHK